MYPGGLKAIHARLEELEDGRRLLDPAFRFKRSCKRALHKWVLDQLPTLQWFVTLTLKQHLQVSSAANAAYKTYWKLTDDEAARITRQFVHQLNRRVLKNAARRYNKSLFYLPAKERDANDRLHLHIGIGGVPDHLQNPYFLCHFAAAISVNPWIDRQVRCDPADNNFSCKDPTGRNGSYACHYITKCVHQDDTDAILWDCMPRLG